MHNNNAGGLPSSPSVDLIGGWQTIQGVYYRHQLDWSVGLLEYAQQTNQIKQNSSAVSSSITRSYQEVHCIVCYALML